MDNNEKRHKRVINATLKRKYRQEIKKTQNQEGNILRKVQDKSRRKENSSKTEDKLTGSNITGEKQQRKRQTEISSPTLNGRRFQEEDKTENIQNKIKIDKEILTPAWTYGLHLWATAMEKSSRDNKIRH